MGRGLAMLQEKFSMQNPECQEASAQYWIINLLHQQEPSLLVLYKGGFWVPVLFS